MSENNVTNHIHVEGRGNSVNFSQSNEFGSDGNEALGLVLKFLVTILLAPVMIPFLLAANGIRMLQGNEENDYGGYND